MSLGEYIGAGSGTTKLLLHLNGNSTDSSGNNNNGVDTAITYSQANGKFGQGAGFNGSSSFINVGSGASLQLGAGPFTFSAWFKKAANGSLGSIYHDNEGTANFFSIGTNSNNTLFFYVAGNTGSTDLLSTVTTITDTNWHLLTVVTESSSSRKIYIDGSYNNVSTTSIPGNISSTREKNIGRNTSGSEYFNGAIDEIIIENVAWSAEKIKKYYTYAKGRFNN